LIPTQVFALNVSQTHALDSCRPAVHFDATVPLLSVVICTLDEHEAIASVIEELISQLKSISYEIIVVDDSPEEFTADAVRECVHRHATVCLLRRQGTNGLSAAAIAGWDIARGKYLAIMDGDGQHDPKLVARMLQSFHQQQQLDMVIASRYLDDNQSGLHGFRHALSRSGIWLADRMLGMSLADPLSGCFMMTSAWYAEVRPQLSGLGFKILVDVVASTSHRPQTAQLPTMLRSRLGGSSKLDLRVAIDLITLLVDKRTRGRLPAHQLLPWTINVITLLLQLALAGLAITVGSPFVAALALALLVSLILDEAIIHTLKPKSERSSDILCWRSRVRLVATRTPLALTGSAALALGLHVVGAPWQLAIFSGGLSGKYIQRRPVA
jgi:dolichol-phosphate mannosyltransferase